MDLVNHFPVLSSSSFEKTPKNSKNLETLAAMNVEKLNSSVPGLAEADSIHDNSLDYLESVTKEVEIYSSDDPTVRQIKTLRNF